MRRILSTVAILAAVLMTAGCFDVHSVNRIPRVLDDFEDGDLNPVDPRFGPWFCGTNNPPNQPCTVGLDPGDQSSYSVYVDTTIVDPPDGLAQYGIGFVATNAEPPVDLYGLDEMVFTLKVTPGNPPLPDTTVVSVELLCNDVPAENGAKSSFIYVQQIVPFSGSWQSVRLMMANFGVTNYEDVTIIGGPIACLRQVNSIGFVLEPILPDGESATGRLNVDDIYFQ
jgi:hypothetical protein